MERHFAVPFIIFKTLELENNMEVSMRDRKQKIVSYIVSGVYLLLLVWLILFKFSTSIYDLPHIRSINMIPFHYEVENSVHIQEVIYNILVFVPAGVYSAAFLISRPFIIKILPSFLMSVAFEAVQYIFSIGGTDITDVIGNTIGGILGLAVFYVIGEISQKHRMRIINTIGIITEVLGIALWIVLMLANR